MLARIGARVWIARIMFTWGVLSTAMIFVDSPARFYVLRFLLGAAEAGFFPGIILYLTQWFPQRERARAVGLFMTATAMAGVIGAPISSALLRLDGAWGLRGWQWLFIDRRSTRDPAGAGRAHLHDRATRGREVAARRRARMAGARDGGGTGGEPHDDRDAAAPRSARSACG